MVDLQTAGNDEDQLGEDAVNPSRALDGLAARRPPCLDGAKAGLVGERRDGPGVEEGSDEAGGGADGDGADAPPALVLCRNREGGRGVDKGVEASDKLCRLFGDTGKGIGLGGKTATRGDRGERGLCKVCKGAEEDGAAARLPADHLEEGQAGEGALDGRAVLFGGRARCKGLEGGLDGVSGGGDAIIEGGPLGGSGEGRLAAPPDGPHEGRQLGEEGGEGGGCAAECLDGCGGGEAGGEGCEGGEGVVEGVDGGEGLQGGGQHLLRCVMRAVARGGGQAHTLSRWSALMPALIDAARAAVSPVAPRIARAPPSRSAAASTRRPSTPPAAAGPLRAWPASARAAHVRCRTAAASLALLAHASIAGWLARRGPCDVRLEGQI